MIAFTHTASLVPIGIAHGSTQKHLPWDSQMLLAMAVAGVGACWVSSMVVLLLVFAMHILCGSECVSPFNAKCSLSRCAESCPLLRL